MITIRKSTAADIPRIMEIIADGQAYFRSQGIAQWRDGYPDTGTIASDITAGNSYVALRNGLIVATAVISFDGEPTYSVIYDGEWEGPSTAKYAVIHRIAVAAVMKGEGIAAEIISFAEQLCPLHSAVSVRIDTHKDNRPMRRLMEKCGYKYCGIILLENGDERLAYEKTTGRHRQ